MISESESAITVENVAIGQKALLFQVLLIIPHLLFLGYERRHSLLKEGSSEILVRDPRFVFFSILILRPSFKRITYFNLDNLAAEWKRKKGQGSKGVS